MKPDQLLDWLSHFEGDDNNVRVTLVRVFLYIAKHGKTTLWDICRDMSMPQSQTFRLLHRLGDNEDKAHVGKGLHYVRRYPDPEKSNRFIYELTEEGQRLYKVLQ